MSPVRIRPSAHRSGFDFVLPKFCIAKRRRIPVSRSEIMNTGLIFALITILLFGSWAVPTKTLKIEPKVQAFWLTIGHLILSSIVFLFFLQPFRFTQFFYPLIAGALWSAGIIAGYRGIKELGITRALGIWIPVVILTSALWGLIYFGEAFKMSNSQLTQTSLSILLLVLAALFVVLSSKGEKKLGNVKVGILLSLILGVIHGSFFIPLQLSNLPITVSFFPMTIGMILVTTSAIIREKLKIKYSLGEILRMMSGGLILGGGNYTALLTIQALGVSQGYPLTQLAIVVNTLWGVFVFKEATNVRAKIFIGIGIVFAIIGAILLNNARM